MGRDHDAAKGHRWTIRMIFGGHPSTNIDVERLKICHANARS
jgi:hypothetical protein